MSTTVLHGIGIVYEGTVSTTILPGIGNVYEGAMSAIILYGLVMFMKELCLLLFCMVQ